MDFLKQMQTRFERLGRQKGVIIWAAKYGAVFAVFLFFFMPVLARLSEYSAKADSMKREIEDTKKISVSLLGRAEMDATRARVEAFEAALTEAGHTSGLLDRISDEAEKKQFQVIQIFSDNPLLLRDEQGNELELSGKKISLLPVNFRVQTDIKSLAAFLHALALDPKSEFIVESLHLQKTSEQADTLQCDITLGFILK